MNCMLFWIWIYEIYVRCVYIHIYISYICIYINVERELLVRGRGRARVYMSKMSQWNLRCILILNVSERGSLSTYPAGSWDHVRDSCHFGFCPSLISVAVRKYPCKSNLEDKRLILTHNSMLHSSWQGGHASRNLNLWISSYLLSRAHKWTHAFSVFSSLFHYYTAQGPNPGNSGTVVGCVFPIS